MSTSCLHKTWILTAKRLALWAALCAAFLACSLLAAEEAVVFLDPGHGGQDAGARGAGGLLEKDVALALAKRIGDKMAPAWSVHLSRKDDYGLELFHRTETANSQKASVFISLHTGGAFNYRSGGLSVYYYLDSPGRVLPEDAAEASSEGQAAGRIPWHSVQYRHAAESRVLSQFLQAALAGAVGSADCRTAGAPLLVLSAADMPAVMIEFGCLNNPAEEEKLADSEYLDLLADAISGGIESYLDRSTDITSIDLHE